MSESLDLWDYRRRVHEIYRQVREEGVGESSWAGWKRLRHELFTTHPQSPVEDRTAFTGIPYFPYDPELSVVGELTPVEEEAAILEHSGDGKTRFVKVGTVSFEVKGQPVDLSALWLDAYGGGVFLPFRDTTNGSSTYGGGRYLLDTVKGADLGHSGNQIVLDFNYSYHPSCVHSPRWSCPLAPPENWLGIPIEAGERLSSA